MSTETITFLNFVVHSLVVGAAAWLLVRFVIRDAMRRCILANLAVLMCFYSPFDISIRDLFPVQQHVPVWTPIRETFEHDRRVKVEPQTAAPTLSKPVAAPVWDMNEVLNWLHRLSWHVTVVLLLRLLVQSIRVQRWAWRLRFPSSAEYEKLPPELKPDRLRVFDGECTPCAAGWFFPVIAVPATAFNELTPQQWRWLIRHEAEHLRCHDTKQRRTAKHWSKQRLIWESIPTPSIFGRRTRKTSPLGVVCKSTRHRLRRSWPVGRLWCCIWRPRSDR